jgi:hypothetical protein
MHAANLLTNGMTHDALYKEQPLLHLLYQTCKSFIYLNKKHAADKLKHDTSVHLQQHHCTSAAVLLYICTSAAAPLYHLHHV